MAVKFTYTMTDADVAKGTESVGRRVSSIRKDVKALTISILYNWAKHGDVATAARRASELLNAVDDSHKQKVVNWFGAVAGFQLADEDGDKSFTYTQTKLTAEQYQAARDGKDLWVMTPDAAPKPYDLRAKLLQLIDQSEKRRAKGLKADDSIPTEMLDGLKALVA